jgi:hypothetical protein
MLRAWVFLLCLAVAIAMPYTATLQGAQGGHRTLVIVENMVRFDIDCPAVKEVTLQRCRFFMLFIVG